MVSEVILGIAFALASSISFAGANAIVSKPLLKSKPLFVNYISIVVGVITSFAMVIAFGQVQSLLTISVVVVALFSVVGILHFGVARLLNYSAVKHIGANQTTLLTSTQVLYSYVLALLFLQEVVNAGILAGAALILIGVVVQEARLSAATRKGNAKVGYAAGLASGAIFGTSAVMIRFGLGLYGLYIPATLVAFSAAMVAFVPSISPKNILLESRTMPRATLLLFIVSGFSSALAQLLRLAALKFAPVVAVTPLIAAQSVFVILFTRLLAKGTELFGVRTLGSVALVVLGTIILSYSEA